MIAVFHKPAALSPRRRGGKSVGLDRVVPTDNGAGVGEAVRALLGSRIIVFRLSDIVILKGYGAVFCHGLLYVGNIFVKIILFGNIKPVFKAKGRIFEGICRCRSAFGGPPPHGKKLDRL